MNCQKFQDALSEYTDGTLEPAEREAFCQHRDTCASCREELSLFEGALAALDEGFPELEPSPLFSAKVWERIRQEPPARPGWRETLAALLGWRPSTKLTMAFASMVLVVSGFFLVPAVQRYQQGQQMVEVQISELVPETRLTEVQVMPAIADIELASLMFEEGDFFPDLQQLGNPQMEETDRILESL